MPPLYFWEAWLLNESPDVSQAKHWPSRFQGEPAGNIRVLFYFMGRETDTQRWPQFVQNHQQINCGIEERSEANPGWQHPISTWLSVRAKRTQLKQTSALRPTWQRGIKVKQAETESSNGSIEEGHHGAGAHLSPPSQPREKYNSFIYKQLTFS